GAVVDVAQHDEAVDDADLATSWSGPRGGQIGEIPAGPDHVPLRIIVVVGRDDAIVELGEAPVPRTGVRGPGPVYPCPADTLQQGVVRADEHGRGSRVVDGG